jgi:hypothetical protein
LDGSELAEEALPNAVAQSFSFRLFLKYGLLTTGMSLLLATGYVWLRNL